MPSLKDLNCSIELSDDQEPLQEFGTVYGDAFVETFIPVPKKQRTFTVHLSSRDFIAPGIAMYVFIDGVYQCNRNRQNMKLRKPPDRRSLVDFKVRQKEEKLKDGSMVAREWTFEKLDHASADVAPHSCSPNILENIGCIEVVVLRCAGPRNAKTAANMNLDGANDYPDYRFDRDSRSRTTAYDDRNPFLSAASKHGPPPRITSYRSPCAETVRSRELPKRAYSRYSESVSPGTHPQRDIPAPAFQYGSGPLPSHSNAGTHRGFLDEAKGSGVLRTASTVDPSMLEKIVADAVKRGVEESMKNDVSNGRRTVSREDQRDVDSSSQVPGAWPTSPTHRSKHHQHRLAPSKRHDRDDHREDRDLVWEHRPTRSRAETRVAWDEELEWDKQSRGDGWCSPEDNLTDSWDIEETWSEKQPHDWEGVRHRSRSCGRVTRSPSRSRRVSYISSRTADRQRSRHGRSHRPRSRSHSQWVNDSKSSSDDTDGWICIEAPSDSSNSLERSDSTLKPSHSRSQVQPSRNKSGRRSSRRQSSQTRHGHRLSQLVGNPQWHPESVYYARPPSVLVTNASTMMSAPISQYQADVRSRKQSIYTWPTASVVAPPPTWGCASEKVRRNSAAMTCLPPAPFSTTGVEHHESRNYSGSSSWGVTQDTSKNKEVKKSSLQQSIWGEDKKSDKTQRAWGEADNKSTDWSPDQEQEWGDDSAAEINGGGWNSTEKDNNGWDTSKDTKEVVVDGWNTDNSNDTWRQDDVKDAEAGSWNAENNDQGWGLNDTSKDEQNPTGGGFEEGDANNNGWNTEQDNDTSWNQPQDTTNDAPFNPDTGWIAAPVVEEKAERKAKSPSTSKRHTSKSLSKYRQLSAPSTEAKPHWQFPPPPSKKTLRSLIEDQASEQSDTTRRIPSAPSEPLYKIPRSVAEEKGVRHQVLAGPGTRYGHAISRPEYIDRLDKPYAVFRFKYRSRSMLRSMFGNDCLSKTGTTMVPAQKEDLEALPQSELIRKMLALQCRLEEKEGEKGGDGETGSQCTESVAMDRAEKWVTQHSREASERGKKKKAESEKSRAKSAEKVAGWDDGEAMKWNGKEVRW